ncbi:RmlC-like jelly roll fold [Phaffia rhodozyma]|uniref:RmlC-like jelly roll fold n=1 Tax=Phaffia rhodozyma TaxID=264483 RepID=A0A0F7SHK0_PHARH|nr:RmlC-like jelly roll fold [Phaffia rhodozyma]
MLALSFRQTFDTSGVSLSWRKGVVELTSQISISRKPTFVKSFSSTLPIMSGPPAHKMAYFANMASSLPESHGEFRTVLWTGLYSQVVLMTVQPGGEIGDEVHTVDQALSFTSGIGKAIVGGEEQDVKAGDLVVVPAGTQHNFINTGPNPLILYTVYSPAEHNPKTVHKTKEEADEHEEDGTDEAPGWSQKSKKENEAAQKN